MKPCRRQSKPCNPFFQRRAAQPPQGISIPAFYAQYDGLNHSELAARYHLTLAQVYRLIQAGRRAAVNKQATQHPLPNSLTGATA